MKIAATVWYCNECRRKTIKRTLRQQCSCGKWMQWISEKAPDSENEAVEHIEE